MSPGCGWRKSKDWRKRIKRLYRICSRSISSGGRNKQEHVSAAVTEYLELAGVLDKKIREFILDLQIHAALSPLNMAKLLALDYFHAMMARHIDLVERRLLKGEKIRQDEKVYSLFEPHTEWISKGKAGVPVELGHNILVASDRAGFIVHYKVVEGTHDVDLALPLAVRLKIKYGDKLKGLSLDKGFYSGDNKADIGQLVPSLTMPKKGKLSSTEYDQEHQPPFKALRNAHSAVESNINQLEHNGLNRCPDKGMHGFRRYVALGVLSYNLHKLGKLITEKQLKQEARQASRAA